MFWTNPHHQAALAEAAVTDYSAVVRLRPSDHFVEKQGRSTGRYVITVGRRRLSVYLKKYYQLSWCSRWFMPLHLFPGPLERTNLERAAALGIPVPEPVAAGAERSNVCRSFLAIRELEGYVPLHDFIPRRFAALDTSATRRLRRALTLRIADIARRLHLARLYHRDLYLCHFFIQEPPSVPGPIMKADAAPAFELVLIDFTRLKHSWMPRWRVKDLAQLLFASDLPGITRTDRMRFFRAYLGLHKLNDQARRLLRQVASKAARYHRHNQALAQRRAA